MKVNIESTTSARGVLRLLGRKLNDEKKTSSLRNYIKDLKKITEKMCRKPDIINIKIYERNGNIWYRGSFNRTSNMCRKKLH